MNHSTAGGIAYDIAKGNFRPNVVLTNMALAYYQDANAYVAKQMFPVLPVQLSTAAYYVFDKGALARDDVHRKPALGRVEPTVISNHLETYSVDVDQIILGIDELAQTNYQRQPVVGSSNPQASKARVISEKMLIHQDRIFANSFFKDGVWSNEWTGADADNYDSQEFVKFTDANSNPIKLFKYLRTMMRKIGRRTPNRLALGENVFNALTENPTILAHVMPGGSTVNPAEANEQVLATLFGVERVVVLGSTYNKADLSAEEDMDFICDPNSALLVYATNTPSIDEPSAGYQITWDMLANGNYMPVLQYPGENGTHSQYIEGLMATTFKKTADDLGIFLKDCV